MTDSSAAGDLHDVVVVGAGAAGLGVAIALQDAGVDDLVVLDRGRVGSSFAAWTEETRFITPSFPTNSVGMLDLNSVAIGTSPAISIGVEHPTGLEYASYLRRLARVFELPIREWTDVSSVTTVDDAFHLRADDGSLWARHVIWAAGEFQYPRANDLAGRQHCRHTATIERYGDLDGDHFIVIGGAESGIDAAYHLSRRGKRVRVFDRGCPWEEESSDPSVGLSTHTLERMEEPHFLDQVELHPHVPIASVGRQDTAYEVTPIDGEPFKTPVPPLLASGFAGGHEMVAHLFERRDDGFPLLSDDDESTISAGLFLCGPAVHHGGESFCFIYKYRQRFAVVAKAIATSLGLPAERLEGYRMWGMYLDDLSCCGNECVC